MSVVPEGLQAASLSQQSFLYWGGKVVGTPWCWIHPWKWSITVHPNTSSLFGTVCPQELSERSASMPAPICTSGAGSLRIASCPGCKSQKLSVHINDIIYHTCK